MTAFKGIIIEGGNAYTMIYKDETGMLRIVQVYFEETAFKKETELTTVNIEADEIEDFIKAITEVK